MNIRDYFESFERPIVFFAFTETLGLVRCDLALWDGSKLTISESVDTSADYPEKTDYSYHYVRGEHTIFRYDSAPHHPGISTFPHHKHVGATEEPRPAAPPTLSAIFAEIEGYLGT